MKKILLCWIGNTDISASEEDKKFGLGPIAQAVKKLSFNEVVLLNDHEEQKGIAYKEWLISITPQKIIVHKVNLSSPTNFKEIYETAVACITDIRKEYGKDVELTYHISPGTSHMAAVWILLAKSRFPAELIDSSREEGVNTVSLPFDISAEFIPNLLRPADKELGRLSEGQPPFAPEFSKIVHQSHVMKRVVAKAQHVAIRSVPVLLEGESGTGKELFARAIHNASPRKDNPFITVNCGAIPADLVESQLFGHVKGAFTGAEKNSKGYFQEADTGTLFLDEIGELPILSQVKLLRVLQENEVVPVGSVKPVNVDIRIIAATNKTLIEEIQNGDFRADLFYRLAVAILKIPPLREREGDLSLLVDHFVEQVNEESKTEPGYKDKKISPDAKNIILSHFWPGNVRELLNTIRRAAIWTLEPVISRVDIEDALIPLGTSMTSDILNKPVGGDFNIEAVMENVAQHYIKKALKEANGKKKKAAELVGLSSYQTLSNWMKKYNVE